MISVLVNNVPISTDDLTSVAPQINRRKDDGQQLCVRIRIKTGSIDATLSTTKCPASAGAFRAPNDLEQRIFLLWERCGLHKEEFSGGQVVTFLQQLSDLLD